MIFAFGSYRHDDCEVALTIRRETQFTEARVPYLLVDRWELEGMIVGDDQADVNAKILALESAYRKTGVDAVLYLNDGVTPSVHRLRNADTLGGIRVVGPPSYPDGRNAEFSTFRRYTIALEAETVLSQDLGGGGQVVTAYEETIRTFGGGPVYSWTAPIRGIPVRQIARERSTYKATQSGFAVGYRSRPAPASPIWPYALIQNPEISKSSPKRTGTGFQDYRIEWNYSYESAEPLAGEPRVQAF